MENFTTYSENVTSLVFENMTTTILSILTTEMELNSTGSTTETIAEVLTLSLTSTEGPVTTSEGFASTISMEDIETSTSNPDDLHSWKMSGKIRHHDTRLPGKLEAAIIISFVGVVLFLAAKYIGCKPSYFCLSFDSFKLSRPRMDNSNPNFIRHENILQRPEYNRPLQYAVYSRPSTANPNSIVNADARGYGYAGFDEEEPQVKVHTRGTDDHIIDPPPEYDSLVPPPYSRTHNNGYSTGTIPAYYTYETSRNIGDVRL